MAALNEGLRDAIAGLGEQEQTDLKMMFGRLMAEISSTFIDEAVAQYPELEPDQTTWLSIVTSRATARAASGK